MPQPLPRHPQPGWRRYGKWLVVGTGLGALYEASDYFDSFQFYNKPMPFEVSGGNWYYVDGCGRLPGAPPYAPNNVGPYWGVVAGHIHAPASCLSGQVPASGDVQAVPYQTLVGSAPVSHGNQTMILTDCRLTPARRARNDQFWWRDSADSPAVEPTKRWYRPTWYYPPDPFGDPVPPNRLRYDPVPYEQPFPPPEPAPDLPPERWSWTDQGPPSPPVQVSKPEPPHPWKKDNKWLSRAAKVGVFLWRLMDTFSELTEIGGSLYRALPEEVRKKWDCGGGLNIGQYGTDVKRCHMEALWNNWHLIDGDKAIREIAKNIVEDMTVGQFHRWLSRVTPRGVNIQRTAATTVVAKIGVEAYIAKKLGELFDALGL